MKTLIVESDFISRQALQAILRPYGFSHIAFNGREAVDAARRALEAGEPYHLICLDIKSPETGGQTIPQFIHDLNEARGILSTGRTKIVITAGPSDLKDVRGSVCPGLCDAYLVKPIDRAKLLDELRKLELINNSEDAPMKILIAEDHIVSRKLLAKLLEEQGYEVVATMNGMEAWMAMQQPDAPKLAILDWMMPEMDGIEACRRIRTLETDQPPHIIILTSRDEKSDIVVGLEAGADDYLTKPYNHGELLARVNVGRRVIEMQTRLVRYTEELKKALREQGNLTLELKQALSQIKILYGLLPAPPPE
jgi:DNA-binding response OmpR family regulator